MTTEETDKPSSPKCTQDDSDSNSTCMICMEEWTIVSEHRICCLKCGHLFGRSCIERWLKEKGAQSKCPTCNKNAKKADIRDIWCKTIKATDNSELNELQKMLENERKLRKTDSAVIFHQNLKLEMLYSDLEKLKRDVIERDDKILKLQNLIDRYNKRGAQRLNGTNDGDIVDLDAESIMDTNVDVTPKELKGMFHFGEKVESSATGGCKSFTLCPTAALILVAQPSPQGSRNIFAGFGLRKYSIIDTSVREFIPLHSKMITSIQLKPAGDLILTSGQDKKVRLTSITNNACIQSYDCQLEPVCVTWSTHRDQQFYVASGNCFISLYDIRNTSECLYQTSRRIANTRLLSMASTTSPENLNGLLVNDSKGSQFLEISDSSDYDSETIDRDVEHLTNYQLPFDGLMGTVDFNKKLSVALITTRRSPSNPWNEHNLVKLNKIQTEDGETKVECKRVSTFVGGPPGELLTQSRIHKHPTLDDQVLVCSCEPNVRGLKLWDSSDNTEYQTITTGSEFIRDTIMYSPENSNQHILYTLSEKGLSIYRWDYA